jgi:hypothetical protein
MKNKLFTLAGALTLFAVLGHFYAKPLLAQVRAALVKNLDERGRNPYTGRSNCVPIQGGGCEIVFPPVPAGMRLVVEHVDISLEADSTIEQSQMTGGSGVYFPVFQIVVAGQFGAFTKSVANQVILAYYEAGESPRIDSYDSSGTSTIGGQGTLSGYLVNLSE